MSGQWHSVFMEDGTDIDKIRIPSFQSIVRARPIREVYRGHSAVDLYQHGVTTSSI